MDRQQLAGKVLEQTGIKLDADDPAFVLVVLNELALEGVTGKVEKQLIEAGDRLNATLTRNVDQFVTVANEALVKFADKTRDLGASVDRMSAPSTATRGTAVPPPSVPAQGGQAAHPSQQWLWWFIPLSFVLGVVVGGMGVMLLRQ